jgi:uncharacterized delta-60 repeat protein
MAGRRSSRILAVAIVCAAVGAGVASAARSASPGSLDRGYGDHGLVSLGRNTRLFGIAVQRSGDAVGVGETGVGTNARLLLARFTPSGKLDHTFGRGGIVVGPAVRTSLGSGSIGRAVAVQSDGKIVVVGKATSANGSAQAGLLIERYGANGSLDRSFGKGGVVNLLGSSFGNGYAVAVASDGTVVATGSADATGSGNDVYPRVAVARLNANGSLDTHFGSRGIDVVDLGPYSYALGVALAPGGKIVIAGSQSPGLQATNALVARLTSSGRLDPSFDGTGYYAHQYAPGGAFSAFNGLAVLGNGQIVAAGAATGSAETADAFAVRFTASGHPNRSFGSDGAAYAKSATSYLSGTAAVPGATAVTITRGGGVLLAGQARTGVESSLALWDFTTGGRPNAGFGSHGQAELHSTDDSEAAGLAIAPGGDVVLAGDENLLGSHYKGLVARYTP